MRMTSIHARRCGCSAGFELTSIRSFKEWSTQFPILIFNAQTNDPIGRNLSDAELITPR
jgi:hypothetical protein